MHRIKLALRRLTGKNKTVRDYSMKQAAFYSKILDWVANLPVLGRPLIVGINGPQGSGKSTLCEALVELSPTRSLRSATLSIDDFYLTHEEQRALARNHPTDASLQQRGYPGTHDISLGRETLEQILQLKQEGQVLAAQYDKSAYEGKGDRFPPAVWKKINGPLDILFFEGWMLGFPIEAYQPWTSLLDAMIFLEPESIAYVVDWRVEAEENRKKSGKAGMSKEACAQYVKMFLPMYEKYHPLLKNELHKFRYSMSVTLGKDRCPV